MKSHLFLLTIIILLFSVCKTEPTFEDKGFLSLEKWDFERDGIRKLDGKWEFYWKKLLLTPEDFDKEPKKFVPVPSVWNDYNSDITGNYKIESGTISKVINLLIPGAGGEGFGTYRLKLTHVPIGKILAFKVDDYATAFNLFVNGKLIAKDGNVETSAQMIPRTRPDIYYFYSDAENMDIVVQVSNFYNAKGGFWHSLKLGTKEQIEKEWETKLTIEFFLIGSLVFMGLYSIILFSMIRKNSSSLFFGAFCLIVSLRQLVAGSKYLLHYFPDMPWELYMKTEYLTFYLAMPIFASYNASLFPKEYKRIALKFFYGIAIGFSGIIILTPSLFYTKTPVLYQIITILCIVYNLYVLLVAMYRKRKGARIFLVASLIFSVTIINDIIFAHEAVSTGYVLSFGFFIFIFLQSFLLSKRFSLSFKEVDNLSKELSVLNEGLEKKVEERTSQLQSLSEKISKYIPSQVYQSIFTGTKEVKIETHRKVLTVFFSDIKGFSEITDTIEPEKLSFILNDYLNEMSIIALKFGGTIDKFIGDAVMIFFGDPESKGEKEDAISCVSMAIAMRERMKFLQTKWTNLGIAKPFQIRVGVNTGYCTVGNFGSEERLSYTIVGNQVNLASRLESNSEPDQILISHETYSLIKEIIRCEHQGEIKVKGIAHPVVTYKVKDFYEKSNESNAELFEHIEGLKLQIDFGKIDKAKVGEFLNNIISRLE